VTLLGFTVVFTALSAWGTVCVAWNAEAWASFAVLAPFKWAYQILVYLNMAAALGGVVVVYAVLRGEKWSYAGSFVALVTFLTTAAVQMSLTSTLKHVSFFATPPTNIRLYTTAMILGFFLLLRLTGITSKAGFVGRESHSFLRKSAGLSLAVAGITTLTTFLWAGPSHSIDGYNLVNAFGVQLALSGGAMLLIGVGLLISANSQARLSLLCHIYLSAPILSWFKSKIS
jgi:hypothetical protein